MSKIEIEDVERLDVRPGDVLLITVPPDTDAEMAERICNRFETMLPVRVIVKTSDAQVQVIGPERVR